MDKAILFSEMTPASSWEDTFNAWYDNEHIPLRMDVPGFVGAQRYRRNALDYLAIYDMESTAMLTTDAYKVVKEHPSELTTRMLRDVSNFSRYIGHPIAFAGQSEGDDFLSAPVLYPVFFDVPENRLKDFDDWYDQDHVPILMECPEWLAVRRFHLEIAEPGKFNRLALHYLADASALDSDARKRARESDWRKTLADQTWFKGTYMVFDRHGERFKGSTGQQE